MRILLACASLLSLLTHQAFSQQTSLTFELNGRPSSAEIEDSTELTQNPFAPFIGEWTLQHDNWTHNWGGETETIKIPGHHTVTSQLNTEHTLLSIIDGPEPNGHIFWTYNPNTQEVYHLSSFGSIRIGKGNGKVDEQGNVALKLVFEGEAEGTYRRYRYEWVDEHTYQMKSVQYGSDDKPTGLFYEGTFVRVVPEKKLRTEMEEILAVLDDNDVPKETQLNVYADDIVHMAPGNEAITNKADLLAYLKQQATYGQSDMRHQIVEFSRHGEVIIMQGKVIGTFHPNDGGDAISFQTKNLFVFKRVKGELKIAKVIYNMDPTD